MQCSVSKSTKILFIIKQTWTNYFTLKYIYIYIYINTWLTIIRTSRSVWQCGSQIILQAQRLINNRIYLFLKKKNRI